MYHKKKKKIWGKRKVKERIFYWSILALPLLQFCIFYIGVNFNSILLSVQKIESTAGEGYVYSWVGFDNFKECFRLLFNDALLKTAFKNSVLAYVFGLVFGIGIALFFSYYIYKKKFGSGLFKVALFLPAIISSVTMVIIFKYFVENAYPAIMETVFHRSVSGLLANTDTAFGTILFYNLWTGFGGSVLLFLGEMNTISDSVVEAAYLDGATPIKEFFHITLPLIFKTLIVFLVTGMAGFFTNQMNLYTFFAEATDTRLYTYGFYLFYNTTLGMTKYPLVAAMGIIFTLIVAPLTLLLRWLLTKYGPSTD